MLSFRYAVIIMSALIVFSCTSAAKREQNKALSELAAPTGPSKGEALKSYAEQTEENMVITVKPNGKMQLPDKTSTPVAASGATPANIEIPPSKPGVTETPAIEETSTRKPGPVAWSQAVGWLKNGNTRFTTGRLRKDGQSLSDIKRLTAGQKPHTVILSCSDSRVPPELVFDQKLGEIFVIRVSGEILDASTVGSIEHAVQNLGTNLVLVMGHTACGAIKAAHTSLSGGSAGSPDMDKINADIQPRIRTYGGKTPSQGYMKESWANVKGVAKDLIERSPILASAVKNGDLKIAEAMYDTASGVVTFW